MAPGCAGRCSFRGLGLVERQRGGQVAEGVDLLPAFGELLLGLRERVGAADEPERRLLELGDRQQRLGELGRVAALLAVHALPERALGGVALGVVLDRRRSVVRGLLREQFGAKKPGLTTVVRIPNGAISGPSDSIQPSTPNFDAA